MFCLRNSINSSLSCWGSWDPIWKNFSESSPIVTFTRSSHSASSDVPSMDNTRGFNCYNLLRVTGSASGLYRMAATMHCRTMSWSPKISSIYPLDGYVIFWCRVEEIAPKVWSQGLATIAVLGEYTSTTIKSTSTISELVCTGNLICPFGIITFPSKLTRGEL